MVECKASEKNSASGVKQTKSFKTEIEAFKQEADIAERDGDFGKVAELRYGKLKEANEKLVDLETNLAENENDTYLIKEEVTTEDIAEVVA